MTSWLDGCSSSFMIHPQLVIAADAIAETMEQAERTNTTAEVIQHLTPLLGVGLAHAQHDLLLWLWRDQ